MKYANYSFSDRRTIENIVPVKEWNKDCHPDNRINKKYGYVMGIYHGYVWRPTKQALINKFTYGPKY